MPASPKESGVAGKYSKTEHLLECGKIVQGWANQVGELKAAGNVTSTGREIK